MDYIGLIVKGNLMFLLAKKAKVNTYEGQNLGIICGF